jgi:phosphonate transport system substrate-binding protein
LRKILIWLFTAVLALQLSACSVPEQDSSIDTLRIGILPDESKEALRDRYMPLFEYLSQETGISCELAIPDSYEELVKWFGEGKIDLAYFGGATFLKASNQYNAVPLVMRDVDTRFTSVLVVADEDFRTIEELQGKRISFGSRLSTSGHLMPRHFLQVQHGITPEKHFSSIQYSGKHDRTAFWVRDGEVDAGIVNSEVIRKMSADGRLRPGEVRIIWTTPPYIDYVWAVHPRVHPAARETIQQAFLQLSADNPPHEAVLSKLGAGAFYPASNNDFSALQQVMDSLEVL